MKTTGFSFLPVLATTVTMLLATMPSYGQNNTIFGCITKSTGQIRIVSSSGQCKSNETVLAWNVQGAQGPQGPAGVEGPQGTAGVPLGACSDSDTKTNILFPFMTDQNGFDTGFSIANTSSDPFGTTATAGTCTLNFFGSAAPSPITTANVAAGTVYLNLVSTSAPGFQGYMIAACSFPLAHGFAFISDIGARNLAMGYLPYNICSPRVAPQ